VTPEESLGRNLAFLAAAFRDEDAEPGPDLDRFARAHSLEEILDWVHPPRLPAEVRERCRAARDAQADRSARLLAALKELTTAFRSANVSCMLLKGLGLGARYYGGLDRRATRDLDLLVREEDLGEAERVLRDLGYHRASIVPFRALALRFTHAFDYVRDGQTVDLHWAIARHASFRFDRGGLRGQPLAIGDLTVDVPRDEDALALCALAVFRDLQRGALRVRALVDLYRIALACPGLDGADFLSRRRAEGTYRITANVFALLLFVLDARGALPAVARAVDAARAEVVVGATTHLRLLLPGRFALGNRLFCIRLYQCSPLRSFLWWFLSIPVRILAYRSWRLPRHRRRTG